MYVTHVFTAELTVEKVSIRLAFLIERSWWYQHARSWLRL